MLVDFKERKKEIQKLRGGSNPPTLKQMADQFGITAERVRQIEEGAWKQNHKTRILDRYKKMYKFQEKYILKHQRYASLGEMVQSGFGNHRSVISYHYARMEELGMIKKDAKISRGIRLLPESDWVTSDIVEATNG